MIELTTVCGCRILIEQEQMERISRGVRWRISKPKGQKPYVVSCGRPDGCLLYLHRLLFDYDSTRWRLVHVNLEPDDNDTVLATFEDVPKAITFGDDETDALGHSVGALVRPRPNDRPTRPRPNDRPRPQWKNSPNNMIG